jgi:mannose-6-phosphate isomerase-like protein (cupin superfamily)
MSTTTAAPPRRRHENPVLGDAATILETAAETDGEHTLLEIDIAPGGGTHPHVHHAFAEHFRAVDGTVTVYADGVRCELKPGGQAIAPIGSVHRFRNETDAPIRIRVELRPGHTGFEESLAIAYGLARDGEARKDGSPRSILHTAALVELSDTAFAGPMRILERPLRALARRAHRRGVLDELRDRYVED